MGHPFLTSIIGRSDPNAVERVRLAALRLTKKQIEREMLRHEAARDALALRYLRIIQAIEKAAHAAQ